jgi:WD40 repeat protein
MLSPDGRTLATVHDDKRVRLWDIASHEMIALEGDPLLPSALAFSPDGQTLATCVGEDGIRLWNTVTGASLARLATSCTDVTFSPDGASLAVAAGGDVTVWDIASHKPVTAFTAVGPAARTAFGLDGKTLAIGTDSGTVTLWDIPTGHPIARLTNTGAVRALTFTTDSLAIADNDGTRAGSSPAPSIPANGPESSPACPTGPGARDAFFQAAVRTAPLGSAAWGS